MAWYDSFLIFTKTIYLLLDICCVWAAYFFLKSLVTPALEMASLYILTILLGLIHVFIHAFVHLNWLICSDMETLLLIA